MNEYPVTRFDGPRCRRHVDDGTGVDHLRLWKLKLRLLKIPDNVTCVTEQIAYNKIIAR